jgi:hypothetical protein
VRESIKNRPAFWFIILSFFSLLVYWIGLIRPYDLLTNYQEPLLNIGNLTLHQPLATLRLGMTFAAQFTLYYLMWRLSRYASLQKRAMFTVLWATVIVLNLAMLWMYPIGAADIFDNIMRGRITAQYGGNPFYETPSVYSQDPFYAYAGWKKFTTAYGPLWELLAALSSRIAGAGILTNILAFKLLGLIAYLGCIKLIGLILEKYAPERTLQGLCLFALNPLVIYETAGNGHNDIVVTFFVLLALVTLLKERFTLSAVSLIAGGLVKFIPIMLLPVGFVIGLQAQGTKRQRWRFAITTAAACATLIAILNGPFWQGGDPFNLTRRSSLLTTSLPAFIHAQLLPSLGEAQSASIVASAALILTAVVAGLLTWHTWREYRKGRFNPSRSDASRTSTWQLPVRIWGWQLMFYLLFTCLWFQPWYVIWPLSLAAILPEGALARLIVMLSGVASYKTILFNLLLPLDGSLPPKSWRESILGPAILGIGWAYVTYLGARQLWQSRMTTRQKSTGV